MNFPMLSRINNQPSRLFSRLQDDFDRLVSELSGMESAFTNEFSCNCEVLEDESNLTFKFDMPGIKKEDVKVELNGNVLSVSAERMEENKGGKKNRYSEVRYGSFHRSFTLPQEVNANKIEAKFDRGVLTLEVPKAKNSTSKPIEIH